LGPIGTPLGLGVFSFMIFLKKQAVERV